MQVRGVLFGLHHSERRLCAVGTLTCLAMVVEMAVGLRGRSLLLTADGLHMGTLAAGLFLEAAAVRNRSARGRTANGHRGTTPGLTTRHMVTVSLGLVVSVAAIWLGLEAVRRLAHPLPTDLSASVAAGCLGLAVSVIAVLVLGRGGGAGYLAPSHELKRAATRKAAVCAGVLIVLTAANFYGWFHLATLASGLVLFFPLRWGAAVVKSNVPRPLTATAKEGLVQEIQARIEEDGTSILSDLQVWGMGPELYGISASLLADNPKPAEFYRALIVEGLPIGEATVEVHWLRAARVRAGPPELFDNRLELLSMAAA